MPNQNFKDEFYSSQTGGTGIVRSLQLSNESVALASTKADCLGAPGGNWYEFQHQEDAAKNDNNDITPRHSNAGIQTGNLRGLRTIELKLNLQGLPERLVSLGAAVEIADITKVSGLVTVNANAHGFITGQTVSINCSAIVSATDRAKVEGVFPITVVTANQFTYLFGTDSLTQADDPGYATPKIWLSQKTILVAEAIWKLVIYSEKDYGFEKIVYWSGQFANSGTEMEKMGEPQTWETTYKPRELSTADLDLEGGRVYKKMRVESIQDLEDESAENQVQIF